MPQMSPIKWVYLYFYSLMILMVFMSILNFIYLMNKKDKNMEKIFNKMSFSIKW
uniref:ATP synthase complex subunit 8 n=1 Tax=Platencyrtus parkeri TaxID=752748 RepID=A0A7G5WI23_9HYME|nr:ATP synthase F0 subunit 8 [Platencyrtus parkeri]